MCERHWLAPAKSGGRNDLVSVFHQTLTFCEGVGGARLQGYMDVQCDNESG